MENKQPQDPKQIAMGCTIILVLALILFFSFKSCFSTKETELSQEEIQERKEKRLKMNAITFTQECVKEKLKSPLSAKFTVDLSHVTILNDTLYAINSYVDSQNSFGAKTRTKFITTITIAKSGDYYRCDEVIFIK